MLRNSIGGTHGIPIMNKAINNITIAKAVDEGYLDEDFFEDTDNPDELVKRVTIYHKVSIDYQSFTSTITKAEKKEKQEKAPALFDLTSLQREASKRLGYMAQQTLDYTQYLYEKKLVSYPRTYSRYLTDDMEASLPYMIGKAEKVSGLTFKV